MNHWINARTVTAVLLMTAIGLAAGFANLTPAQADDASPLVKAMDVLNDNYKDLRRTARRGNFDGESIKQLLAMQKACIDSKMALPTTVEKAGDKKKAMTIAYHKKMNELLVVLAEVEVAVLEGRVEAAQEGVNKLAALKKDGHDAFIEE